MIQSMDLSPSSPGLPVAVVADDPLARAGLVKLLEDEETLQIVAEAGLAGDPAAGLEDLARVLLVDLGWEGEEELPELTGWTELGTPILLLVPPDLSPGPLWGLGVGGLLARDRPAEAIAAAARAVAADLFVLDPAFARPAVRAAEGGAALESLTPREIEVLKLLAGGRSNRAIAHELSISEHTVKFHVTSILGKLGAESRTEAAVLAARAGLIII